MAQYKHCKYTELAYIVSLAMFLLVSLTEQVNNAIMISVAYCFVLLMLELPSSHLLSCYQSRVAVLGLEHCAPGAFCLWPIGSTQVISN